MLFHFVIHLLKRKWSFHGVINDYICACAVWRLWILVEWDVVFHFVIHLFKKKWRFHGVIHDFICLCAVLVGQSSGSTVQSSDRAFLVEHNVLFHFVIHLLKKKLCFHGVINDIICACAVWRLCILVEQDVLFHFVMPLFKKKWRFHGVIHHLICACAVWRLCFLVELDVFVHFVIHLLKKKWRSRGVINYLICACVVERGQSSGSKVQSFDRAILVEQEVLFHFVINLLLKKKWRFRGVINDCICACADERLCSIVEQEVLFEFVIHLLKKKWRFRWVINCFICACAVWRLCILVEYNILWYSLSFCNISSQEKRAFSWSNSWFHMRMRSWKGSKFRLYGVLFHFVIYLLKKKWCFHGVIHDFNCACAV